MQVGIETAAWSNGEAVFPVSAGAEFSKTLSPKHRGNPVRLRLKGRVRKKVTEMSSEAAATKHSKSTLSECH